MEYLEGLSLRDLVVFHGPLSTGRVIYLMTQVCEGLAEAHAAGLIHRDLKPANLFAAHVGRRYDVAKVLDFGLVKDTTLRSGGRGGEEGVVGTLAFMAPEQRSGEPGLDHRADLFAVGAVAYYLLTARLPFTDKNGLRPLVAPGPELADPALDVSSRRPCGPGAGGPALPGGGPCGPLPRCRELAGRPGGLRVRQRVGRTEGNAVVAED